MAFYNVCCVVVFRGAEQRWIGVVDSVPPGEKEEVVRAVQIVRGA